VLETFKLYSATQCDSDACLTIRLVSLCKIESTMNQKLAANSNIASRCEMSTGLVPECVASRGNNLTRGLIDKG